MEINEPDVAHVNSASEGSRSRNTAWARGAAVGAGEGTERGRSKKHRIACYRAGASKCSKYAPNARPRGPNRPMQITGRPPGRIRIINGLSRDRCRNGRHTRVYTSELTLTLRSLVRGFFFVFSSFLFCSAKDALAVCDSVTTRKTSGTTREHAVRSPFTVNTKSRSQKVHSFASDWKKG